MGLPRKLDALLALRPDIAVLSEVGCPEVLAKTPQTGELPISWIGDNPHKGLAVISFTGNKLVLDASCRSTNHPKTSSRFSMCRPLVSTNCSASSPVNHPSSRATFQPSGSSFGGSIELPVSFDCACKNSIRGSSLDLCSVKSVVQLRRTACLFGHQAHRRERVHLLQGCSHQLAR